MTKLKYFIQFLGISFLFLTYKLLGLKLSSVLSGKILTILGPLFRSNTTSYSNLSKAFPKKLMMKKKKLLKVCGTIMEKY